jgi:alkanesulfonate monooxygenase
MTVEFIGYVGTRKFSGIHPAAGPVVDLDHIETAARAHEAGGLDRVLVAFHSGSPEK